MKQSNFNYEGEDEPLYCKKCSEPDMVDIKHPKCLKCKKKHPAFNYEGEVKPLYCKDCSKNGMVDVKSPKCIKCKNKCPNFNYKGETKALYCKDCSEDGMVDVKNSRCKSEWCDTRAGKKYEGYCLFCFINLYPDSPLVRNHKTKEKSVVDFINENFEDYEWVKDKTVDGGCSKKRPDMMLDFGSHIIIIEIDENAHIDYDCSCENKRLMEISKDLGHRPIVFIRFNPDSYTNKDVKKIKSCWSANKISGILYINDKKQWKYRLRCLKEQIEYWIENETDKMVEIVQLFYNEN